jgi:hypothetical protein
MQSRKEGNLVHAAGYDCGYVFHNVLQPKEDGASSASAQKGVVSQHEARVIVAPLTVTSILQSD